VAGALAGAVTLWGAVAHAEPAAVAAPSRMDQVQREALNPLKRILEVGAPPARAAAPRPASAAALAATARPPAAASAPEPVRTVAVPAKAEPAAAAAVVLTPLPAAPVAQAAPAAPLAAPVAPATPPQPVAAPVAAPVAQAALAPAAAASAPALSPPAGVTTVALATPALRPVVAAPVAAPPPQPTPQLVSMVEPAFTWEVRDRLRGEVTVMLDLVIQPDGSVASAAVRGTVDRRVASAVLTAVRQWRYDALPQSQPLVVALKVNLER
jgi:hypothetical protein